ncbi:MAG: histidine kinase [Bacteroidales bacterium]
MPVNFSYKSFVNSESTGRYSPFKILLTSLVGAIFILYPNITFFSVEKEYYLKAGKYAAFVFFFIFRYAYFSLFICSLLLYNLNKLKTPVLGKRFLFSFLITAAGYFVYIGFSLLLSPKKEWYSGMLLFQFFVMLLLSMLIGHVSYLYSEQRKKEKEIEKLKIENLQSRYNALSNQINPHFFFNSLNGLSSVIRIKGKESALKYIDKLSDVFRYILQSDKKALVTLGEELDFVKSFLYMMEIRFANKLKFRINVGEDVNCFRIPVLSLLPLIENVVMHNIIDSEYHMVVDISLNDNNELVISNPVFPKLTPPETNGTGLKNLDNRFQLLMNKKIRVENDGKRFTVYLPLKKEDDESIDS